MFHLVAILATIGIFTADRSTFFFSLPRAEYSEASTDDQYTLLALSPVPQIRPTIVYSVCVVAITYFGKLQCSLSQWMTINKVDT